MRIFSRLCAWAATVSSTSAAITPALDLIADIIFRENIVSSWS
jgi:hypothetical protein